MTGLMIVVVIVSFVLSLGLNKLAEKKGWKDAAMKYIDEKPQMKSMPIIIGVIGVIALLFLGRMGINIYILVPVQVVIVTLAVFLFELFREV